MKRAMPSPGALWWWHQGVIDELCPMFEGTPLPAPPWELLYPGLAGVLLVIAVLAALRMVHFAEWQLTWGSLTNPRGMWFGRHVEGGSTMGLLMSHLLGILGWGVLGWATTLGPCPGPWLPELPLHGEWIPAGGWRGAAVGAGVGLALIPLRGAARGLVGWLVESRELSWQHAETDRLLRNVLAVVLVVEVLAISVQSRVEGDVIASREVYWMTFGIFLIWRGIRLLQLVRLSGLSIGWGIAYLCTLELIPTWVLLSALLEG